MRRNSKMVNKNELTSIRGEIQMKYEEFIKNVKSGQQEFKGIDLEGSFINEDLSNLVFENCFIVADFTGSNLSRTCFTECNLKTCIFNYANLEQAEFSRNNLDAADFMFAQYSNLIFKDNTSYSSIFTKEILEDTIYAQLPGFHIVKVYAGWFEVMLMGNRTMSIISASDYLGNDAPKELIEALCEMSENDMDKEHIERWLCWDEEPGAFIWKIVRNIEKIQITVNIAKRDSGEIKVDDRKALEKEEIYSEDILIEGQFYFFCKEVIKSFEKIRKMKSKENYEENWGVFPDTQLKRLNKALANRRK
jgi:hypothetical protein